MDSFGDGGGEGFKPEVEVSDRVDESTSIHIRR